MKRWRTISQRSPKEVTLSFLAKVFCLVLVRFFLCYLRFFLCCPCKVFWGLSLRRPHLLSVIARSEATKQSRFPPGGPSGCFAPLATTGGGVIGRVFFVCHYQGPFLCHCEPLSFVCHCEERSDEAISLFPRKSPSDCFASLATTGGGVIGRVFFVLSLRGAFFLASGAFFVCHCEERSDEAISLFPREAPEFALLRSQRQKEGRHWEGLFCLSLPEAFFCVIASPFLLSVIARSEATKQSRFPPGGPSGCFASLAKTGGGVIARSAATKQSRFFLGRPLSLLRSARKDRERVSLQSPKGKAEGRPKHEKKNRNLDGGALHGLLIHPMERRRSLSEP